MKLSFILILIGVVNISASVYSQNKKFTFSTKNATIEEILNSVEEQSEFKFFFQREQVDVTEKVNLEIKDSRVENVLDKMFENRDVKYKVYDNNLIILVPKAQENKKGISGTVKDQSGLSLPGVNITVKGSTNGTMTNSDGTYTIDVKQGDVLMFAFVGYKTQEVTVGSQSVVDVVMQEDIEGLDEVVVVGYGTMKKSDLTGAVASVKSEKINKVAASNPAAALQGQVAGVVVTNVGGGPGAGATVKIRGISSINNSDPLYIIDGVPGSFYMVNPEDIESIEILKDGAAAAIYGTEAANGVVLITTKKGEKGKMKVNFSMKNGLQVLSKTLDMCNSEQYVKVAKMAHENAGLAVPAYLNSPIYYDTDWFDAVSRDAWRQEYNVSLSGGNEKVNYFVSAGWLDHAGTLIGSKYDKGSIRSNINYKGDLVSGGIKFTYTETESQGARYSLKETYHILPLVPIFDDSQKSGFGYPENGMPNNKNPLGMQYYNKGLSTDQFITTTAYLDIPLYKGLKFHFDGGYQVSNKHSRSNHPIYQVDPQTEVRYPKISESRSNYKSWTINNILSYDLEYEDHKVNAMVGYVATKSTNDYFSAGVEGKKIIHEIEDGKIVTREEKAGFLDPWFNTLNSGKEGVKSIGGSRNEYTKVSTLGRINYSFMNRYLFQATVRRDGSSKFGEDSRYGTFPSVAASWRLSEEDFVKDLGIFSNLKLRASYAKLGNENSLGLYQFLPLIQTVEWQYLSYSKGAGSNIWVGSISRDLENKELHWEITKTLNIGLDFGLLGGKLNGSVNYYKNETNDMLVNLPIPSSSGLDKPKLNYGDLENKGIELELSYNGKVNDFKYEISGTFSANDNEVIKLGEENQTVYGEGLKYGDEHFANQTKVGYAIGSFFLYQTDGLFQTQAEVDAHNAKGKDGKALQPNAKPGDIRFRDVNGDGVLDDKDKEYSGQGLPKYNYSLNLSCEYKGFDLSMMLYGVGGNKIYNGNKYYLEGMLDKYNYLSSAVDAWTPQNTNTDVPRAVIGDPNQNSRESTRFLEDGDFLRLKNLQIGYTLPKELTTKFKVERLRVYISGENLFTITKYDGQDPEVGRSSVFNSGLDRTLYPISKLYMFGLQLSF